MNQRMDLDRFFKKYDLLISLLMILFVIVRKWTNTQNTSSQPLAVGLIFAFLISFLIFPVFAQRFRRWSWIYLICQVILIETLGFLPPEEDTWSLLYIPLWAEIKMIYAARKSYLLMSVFGTIMITTLTITFEWYIGIGYGVYMAAVGLILMSPALVYTQYVAANMESKRLLDEIKTENIKLKKAARQAEELAAIQERMRLANELHDSVSQVMFSIKLLAQSTRLLMDKDPEAVLSQLNQLQELSGRALQQMRSLITQWRETV